MKKADFSFNAYPFRYSAKYHTEGTPEEWKESITEFEHRGAAERTLNPEERASLLVERNKGRDLPIVNYTTQYGLSCFEGLKAFPHPDGSLRLFRPDMNAARFYRSMEALYMPPFSKEKFVEGTKKILALARDRDLTPRYAKEWKDDGFSSAKTVYVRAFTYSEAGLGLNISKNPWVLIYASEVGNYLDKVSIPSLLVSEKVRATPHGTGWIKCSSNYVISILAKEKAKNAGFTEALFLNMDQTYIEECSSCNVFFVLNNGTIVTPALGDTILPGITRDSAITLARDHGYSVEERKISIQEVLEEGRECFATGTAVGIEHFGSLTCDSRTVQFGDGKIGPITKKLQSSLKDIQYGIAEDKHAWLVEV